MQRLTRYLIIGIIICSLAMLVSCDGFQGRAYEREADGSIGPTIAGVEITFVKEDGSAIKSTVTDGAGSYRVTLGTGRYVVTATHPDYEDYSSVPGFFVVTGDGYQTGNFFLRDPRVTTVLLVRHAEKAAEPLDDPPLTPEGEVRAKKLAHVARKAGVTAIYTTDTKRTRQTVQPLADSLKLQPILYGTPQELVNQMILPDHNGDVVLVAGHGPTVPQIAQQLGANIPIQSVDDYDNLFVATRKGAGRDVVANIVNLQYGQPSPLNVVGSNHPMPTLLLVRHTEGGRAGAVRAEKLAHVARLADVDVIFANPPQQTVQPLADILNLAVNSYPPNGVEGIITQLLAGTSQLFVVAGENDNLSDIIEKLSGHPTPPLFPTEYDNLFLVTAYQADEAKVLSLQYGKRSR